jgi:hypothetical protein
MYVQLSIPSTSSSSASYQPSGHHRPSRVCAYRRYPAQTNGNCATQHRRICSPYRTLGTADGQTAHAAVNFGCGHATTHHCPLGGEGCTREPHVCHQHHSCSVRSWRADVGACHGHSAAQPTCGPSMIPWHLVRLDNDQLGRRSNPRMATPRHSSQRTPSPAISRTFSPIGHSSRHNGPAAGGSEIPPGAAMPTSFDSNLPVNQPHVVVRGGSPYATSSGPYHHSDAISDAESYALPRQPRAAHQHPAHHQSCPYDHFCPLQPDNGSRSMGDPFHASVSSVRPTVVAQPVMAFAPLSPAGVVGGAVSPVPVPFTQPLQPVGVMAGSFMTHLLVKSTFSGSVGIVSYCTCCRSDRQTTEYNDVEDVNVDGY